MIKYKCNSILDQLRNYTISYLGLSKEIQDEMDPFSFLKIVK